MDRIDEETMEAFKRGQMKAFEKIYRFYNGRVYNFVYAMLKDSYTSKDLTQDVFVQIWNKRENIDSNNNFDGYIFTVAKNMVYVHIRRELLLQNYINKTESDTNTDTSEIERKLDDKLWEENILKLIEDLPDGRKKVFLLYWKSGMNYKEIADVLSISEKTVATQVRRSLQFLREKIDGDTLAILLIFLSGNLL